LRRYLCAAPVSDKTLFIIKSKPPDKPSAELRLANSSFDDYARHSHIGLARMFRTKACVIAALGAALSVSIMILGGSAWAQSAQYTLIVRNHEFQPTELQLPAGQKIELRVTNADPTPEEFESPSLNREKVIPGGQTVTIYIGPLTPGRYEFFGDFNPKTARGTIVAK
jgi:hypothetical protein